MSALRMFAAWIVVSGCGLHGSPSDPEVAAPSIDADRVVAPGIVEPWDGETAVAPREAGWIARILVTEGQRVEAGAVLAVLDDGAQRAGVVVARADVAEAEAALARLQRGATAEERRALRAEAAAARARAELARTEARRATELAARDAVAEAEAERARADAAALGAVAEASTARVAALERGPRDEDRAIGRARLAAARARLELAEAALERRRVVAPIAGTVLASRFHAGELASGAPLFVLGDVSRLRVRLEVDELDSFAVRPDARCELVGDDGRPLGTCTVRRVAPAMGRRGLATEAPTSRVDVRVRELFAEVDATTRLVPGQRVWGRLAR